jgi:hypothetical protein
LAGASSGVKRRKAVEQVLDAGVDVVDIAGVVTAWAAVGAVAEVGIETEGDDGASSVEGAVAYFEFASPDIVMVSFLISRLGNNGCLWAYCSTVEVLLDK